MQHCDSKCGQCARNWFKWLKAREAQMSMVQVKKGMTTSFADAARTSNRPPRPYEPCTCTWKPGDKALDRWHAGVFEVVHNLGYVGGDGRHWVNVRGEDGWTFCTECGTLRPCVPTSPADF